MENLSAQLQSVIKVKNLSKVGRFLHDPFKYFYALYTRFLYYPLTKKGKLITTETFFGDSIDLLLPAGTDIYLTGGKSHDSELRLSSFIIDRLKSGDVFIDVGAHYGFFSLLASQIVGSQGRVISYEGGNDTYQVLNSNLKSKENITAVNKVVSNTQGLVHFYQFPTAYSEYNSLDIEQYKELDWFKANIPKATPMQSIRLSNELDKISAKIIKIDVEGGEMGVLKGLEEYLDNHSPIIVIEYLSTDRKNQSHILAAEFLMGKGFVANTIIANGTVQLCDDIETYMNSSAPAKHSLIH